MGQVYRLSPTTYNALGYICIQLSIGVIFLVFWLLSKRNKQRILLFRKRQQQQDGVGEENGSITSTPEIHWKEYAGISLIQTGIFAGVCLSFAFVNRVSLYWYWIVLALWFLAWCVSRRRMQRNYPLPENQQQSNAQQDARAQASSFDQLGALVLFFAVQFCWVSVRRCFVLAPLAVYDYHGPVRVIGYNDSYIGQDGENNLSPKLRDHYFHCPVDEAVGQIQVAWGGAWACPSDPTKECKTMVHSFHCDFAVCENCNGQCLEEEYESTIDASNYCVQNSTRYSDTWELLQQGISYNPEVAPEEDTLDWATEIMYADCDTCEAEFAEIVEQQTPLRASKEMVYLFGGIFGGLLLVYGVCWGSRWLHRVRQ